jgi:hypothetical protein
VTFWTKSPSGPQTSIAPASPASALPVTVASVRTRGMRYPSASTASGASPAALSTSPAVVRVSRNHTPASTTSTITTSGAIDRLGIRGGA